MTAALHLPPVLYLLAALLTVSLTGCASRFNEAPQDAVISTAAGAPGYVVLGLADENAGSGLTHTTLSLALALRREDGITAVMNRDGCGSMQGFYGSNPCDLTKLGWQVLQVQPGLWRPVVAAEVTSTLLGRNRFRSTLPPGSAIPVGSGEVVYLGDYVLAVDFDGLSVAIRRHERNDAAAQRALAAYPGLRDAQVVFRDPTIPAAQR